MDKLGEIGGVLKELSDAVKTAKLLQKEGSDLTRITEDTKKATNEIKELQIPNEPLVDEIQKKVPELCDSADNFIQTLKNFTQEIAPFEKYVEDKILVSILDSIPLEVVKEFCKMLENLYERGMDFSNAFSIFIGHVNRMQELAVEITDNLTKKQDEIKNEADFKSNLGYGGAACLVAAGVGFVALAFFTGGLSVVAAGAVAGVAAGCVGTKTYLDVKELRSNAGRISGLVNKLNLIGKHIRSINDRAGKIKLDEESIESLKVALNLYKKQQEGMENKEKLSQAEAQLKKKEEELARKDAELEELRAQLKRSGN